MRKASFLRRWKRPSLRLLAAIIITSPYGTDCSPKTTKSGHGPLGELLREEQGAQDECWSVQALACRLSEGTYAAIRMLSQQLRHRSKSGMRLPKSGRKSGFTRTW